MKIVISYYYLIFLKEPMKVNLLKRRYCKNNNFEFCHFYEFLTFLMKILKKQFNKI